MSFTFSTPTPRGWHLSKMLDVKTFLFSSSNRETQRCNSQKSRLSRLLSLVQKQLQKYIIRDLKLFKLKPSTMNNIQLHLEVSSWFLHINGSAQTNTLKTAHNMLYCRQPIVFSNEAWKILHVFSHEFRISPSSFSSQNILFWAFDDWFYHRPDLTTLFFSVEVSHTSQVRHS